MLPNPAETGLRGHCGLACLSVGLSLLVLDTRGLALTFCDFITKNSRPKAAPCLKVWWLIQGLREAGCRV